MAMVGFIFALVGEVKTGLGPLGQMGLDTPDDILLILLCVLFGGATLVGAASTASRALGKKMSKRWGCSGGCWLDASGLRRGIRV